MCDILAIFVDHLRHLAHLIHVIAQIVFYSTVGCMAAQVNYEVDYRRATRGAYASIPTGEFDSSLSGGPDLVPTRNGTEAAMGVSAVDLTPLNLRSSRPQSHSRALPRAGSVAVSR